MGCKSLNLKPGSLYQGFVWDPPAHARHRENRSQIYGFPWAWLWKRGAFAACAGRYPLFDGWNAARWHVAWFCNEGATLVRLDLFLCLIQRVVFWCSVVLQCVLVVLLSQTLTCPSLRLTQEVPCPLSCFQGISGRTFLATFPTWHSVWRKVGFIMPRHGGFSDRKDEHPYNSLFPIYSTRLFKHWQVLYWKKHPAQKPAGIWNRFVILYSPGLWIRKFLYHHILRQSTTTWNSSTLEWLGRVVKEGWLILGEVVGGAKGYIYRLDMISL